MDTTQVVVAATLLPLYWKFFLIGLLGNAGHAFKSAKTNKVPFIEYVKVNHNEIIWGVLCYQFLIWIWHDWTLIAYTGLSDKMSLNMGTIFIGYFSSSIFDGVLLLWEYAWAKIQSIGKKKIDSIGDKP